MTKHKTNAADWSGKELEYKVYSNGDLGVYDYRFKCKTDNMNAIWDFKGLCSVYADRGVFYATSYYSDLSRDGTTPHEAAARVAANTV